MITKHCGKCAQYAQYDESASYCIHCGERSLDYRCTCGRSHAGGMPCHCEKPYVDNNPRIIHNNQYNTINLRGLTLEQYTTPKHLWKEKGIE